MSAQLKKKKRIRIKKPEEHVYLLNALFIFLCALFSALLSLLIPFVAVSFLQKMSTVSKMFRDQRLLEKLLDAKKKKEKEVC